jgi:ATP-dependent RNA helicase DeaD
MPKLRFPDGAKRNEFILTTLSSVPVSSSAVPTFADLNINAKILRAIQDMGYESPSPIQAQALPQLLGQSTDFLGLAATGTGKTAAFSIPLLDQLDPSSRAVQGLVLCPTRELAMQVTDQINLLGKYLGVTALPIYGGASYNEQHRGLYRGAAIVVGTPGRICDHIRQGTLKLDKLKVLVLDEADEMISMGFKDDLTSVLDSVPEGQAKTWLFSATMSPDVRRVADTYLKDPAQVQVNRTEMVPSSIQQIYYVTHESNKPDVLCKLIDSAEDFYGLIFCQTKALVADLSSHLMDRGYRVDSLHGDKTQAARETTMKAFRDRKVKVLICTDVAARGLDVKDVTHVINYSIPRELDSYVHRIGRTARCGKSGVAMSLIAPRQRNMIAQIERLTKSTLEAGTIPTRRELGKKKVSGFLPKFQEQEHFSRAIESMSDEWKAVIAAMTPEEVAGRFLTLNFTDIFNEKDVEAKPFGFNDSSYSERSNRGDRRPRARFGDRDERPRVSYGDRPRIERPDIRRAAPVEGGGQGIIRDEAASHATREYRAPKTVGFKKKEDKAPLAKPEFRKRTFDPNAEPKLSTGKIRREKRS